MKNKFVEFCAYSVPHPSEQIMNVRVQCCEGDQMPNSNQIVKASLRRISKTCDVLTEKFAESLAEFKAAN